MDQQVDKKVVELPKGKTSVLSMLDEAVNSTKETANTLRLEIDHDHDTFTLTGKIDELIMARKPSSTGTSKGCMINFNGPIRQVKRGDKWYDIILTQPRGGSWVSIDVKEAEAPKTRTA